MPRNPGILLDFLAPRLFLNRNPLHPRGACGACGAWTLGSRNSGLLRHTSSAALLKDSEVVSEPTGQEHDSTSVGRNEERERYLGESIAGPSRLKGLTEGLRMGQAERGRVGRKSWLSPAPPLTGQLRSAEYNGMPGQLQLAKQDDNRGASATGTISTNPESHQIQAATRNLILLSSRSRQSPKGPPDRSLLSHLRQPNPPDPTHLLHSHPLTRTSGELLLRYAERIDDRRSERDIRDRMGRLRLAPVRYMDPRQRGRRRGLYLKQGRWDNSAQQDIVQSGDVGDEGVVHMKVEMVRPPISSELRDLRARSNIWARRMWPPNPCLPTAPDPTPQGFLRHQHHLFLGASSQPSFARSLEVLGGMNGITERHLRELLHLFLVYTPHQPADPGQPSDPNLGSAYNPEPSSSSSTAYTLPFILTHFLTAQPQIQPTRQTLHLLVRYILSSPSSSLSPSLKSAHIQSVLELFRSEWGIRPGCETLRHVMKFALYTNDRNWGRVIWDAWWDARERDMKAATIGESTLDGQDTYPDCQSGDNMGEQEHGEEEEEEAIFRFKHLGIRLNRWMRVVKRLEGKGWVRRMSEDETSTRLGHRSGWIWVDEGAERSGRGEEL